MSSRKEKKYAALKDVAKLANTSIASVSHILNSSQDRYVSPELRQRVMDAVKELNYTKSAVASSLKGKNRGIIALLIPQFENMFFTRIAISVEHIAYQHGYILSICNTLDDPKREKDIIEKVISQRMDGLIIGCADDGVENTRKLRELNIPYVAIERPLEINESYSFVSSNNYQSGLLAGRYLKEKGHKDIAFIEWESRITNVKDRRVGFEEEIRPAIERGGKYISIGSRDLTESAGYELTRELLSTSRPTAIMYGHHILACGGVQYLYENNIRIPDDISVAMIGVPKWSQINIPRFVCIKQPEDEIGELAARMLFDKLLNEGERQYNDGARFILDSELLAGGSVKDMNG